MSASARALEPDVETLCDAELRALQDVRWDKQWRYVRERSRFYSRKFAGAPQDRPGLDDLGLLPLTDKEELRAAQESEYPFGEHIACAPEQVVRIHRTSGTTGRSLVLANSAHDVAVIARVGARGMFASGLRPADRVIHCLNYCMWTGGVTDHLVLEAAGATVIPFGTGNTRLLVETIIDLGVTAISCTPSYPALLESVLREEFGREPRELGLRLALFGGEPGLDNVEFRRALEERWGFAVRNANFGMSEVMSIMGSQCEHTTDLHFLAADFVFPELLDPATGRRIDMCEGATGELVCTHLEKECQPLVRYRTRDVITVTGTGACSCGRTSPRFRVTGRTDEMFNVRGVNVFPTAVQRVLAAHAALCSGQFRILLDGPGPYDRIRIRAEAARDLASGDFETAARTLEAALRAALQATAEVRIDAFESLPRTDGKTSLIERSAR